MREWLDDFATPETVRLCEPLLESELNAIREQMPGFYPVVRAHYDRVAAGERDLFF